MVTHAIGLIVMYGAGLAGGWALRGIVMHRRFLRIVRLTDDALLEQNLPRAKELLDRNRALLEIIR